MRLYVLRSAIKTSHISRPAQRGLLDCAQPRDLGGVRRLEKRGFKALASTSAGAAWAAGRNDGELSRDDVLEHLRLLCGATDLPVNADFESGFADQPERWQPRRAPALETGVAGLSIEDRTGRNLYEQPLAVDRIRAAHEAIARSDQEVVLVGRSEGYLIGRTELAETIDRLVAYADAGADCLYAPGITDLSAIRHPGFGRRAEARQCVADRSEHARRGSGRRRRPTSERGRRPSSRSVVRF